jgi:DNA-binding transcriptional LysR family regulator
MQSLPRHDGEMDHEKMGLWQLELSMLIVFDTVMAERNVSRAAKRLGRTQPGISNAISRLRQVYNDPLFERTAVGVVPTPKALELWPLVHKALGNLEATIGSARPDPSTFADRFRICLGDISASLLMPGLLKELESAAPNATIFLTPYEPIRAASQLMRDEVDFVISIDPLRNSTIQYHALLSDGYHIAARVGHPIFSSNISLEEFCSLPSLVVNSSGSLDGTTPLDNMLAERNLVRNIRISVNDFSVAASLIANSDLVAAVPSRLAFIYKNSSQIAVLRQPITAQFRNIYLNWHKRSVTIASHVWLKERLIALSHALSDEEIPLVGPEGPPLME